jgi:hypothetical protein
MAALVIASRSRSSQGAPRVPVVGYRNDPLFFGVALVDVDHLPEPLRLVGIKGTGLSWILLDEVVVSADVPLCSISSVACPISAYSSRV